MLGEKKKKEKKGGKELMEKSETKKDESVSKRKNATRG